MSYQYTIQDITKISGLKDPFVRRFIRECKNLIDDRYIRGDNNSMLFDEGGLSIFDRVSQWKRDGHNLVDIKTLLSDELISKKDAIEPNTIKEEGGVVPPQKVDALVEEIRKSQEQLIQGNEKVLEAKEEVILSLRQQFLLLTDGRSAEEVAKDRLKTEEMKDLENQKRLRRVGIIGELKALEGRFFVSERRMDLLKELEQLC